ncbi:PmbA/TldA family metallopeptidase, partial [Thiocapsa sp.]|uniref:PmbA/TldA family metallopeptidase n=1 Tax=Thiocapsa sp. TaxID=2024551 RepID=UPI0035936ABC
MQHLCDIADIFLSTAPGCDYWTLRLVEEEHDHLEVRQGVVEPSRLASTAGAMVTLVKDGGIGYGATGDLSAAGLRAAAERAA